MNNRRGLASIIAVVAALAIPATSGAIPFVSFGTLGLKIIVTDPNPIIFTFLGSTTEYRTDLYLALDDLQNPCIDGNPGNDCFLFNSRSAPVGSQVDLGSFAVGTELTLRLFVRDTGSSFYTGPATRNLDGALHSWMVDEWRPGETLICLEDRFDSMENSCDFDYDDLTISYRYAAAPVDEPWSLGLFAVGALGMVLRNRRDRA